MDASRAIDDQPEPAADSNIPTESEWIGYGQSKFIVADLNFDVLNEEQ